MAFVELLGPKLLSKDGEVDTASALAGKRVGLYFSAHWCPPCRGFTPELAKSYTSALKAKGLEIVFVSGDAEESAFRSYYGEMPWLALPYSAREKKDDLNSKFQVQGIPSLILLDSDGTKLTSDGRSMVSMDPAGEGFPWTGGGTGEVPRGMTMKFAEKKAKPMQLIGPLMEKVMIAGAIPGVIELALGLYFAMSPCGTTLLVKWLLADGLWSCISSGRGFIKTKKNFEVQGSTDLQAYLIHKERDGIIDEDMEAKLAAAKPDAPSSMLIFFLLFLGIYFYSVTSSEGCNEAPSNAVFYVLMMRFLWPCLVGCISGPAMVGTIIASSK